MPLSNYPYTNLHEMNLDWIIPIIKEFQEHYTGINTALDNAIAEIVAKGEATVNDLEALQSQIESALNTQHAEIEDALTSQSTEITNALSELETAILTQLTNSKNSAIAEITSTTNTGLAEMEAFLESMPADIQEIIDDLNQLNDIVHVYILDNATKTANVGAGMGATIDLLIDLNNADRLQFNITTETANTRQFYLWAYYNHTWNQITSTAFSCNTQYIISYNKPDATAIRAQFFAGNQDDYTFTAVTYGILPNEIESIKNLLTTEITGTTASNTATPGASQGTVIDTALSVKTNDRIHFKITYGNQINRQFILFAYYNNTWNQVTSATFNTNTDYTIIYTKPNCTAFRAMFYAGDSAEATFSVNTFGDIINAIEEQHVIRVGPTREYKTIQDALDNAHDSANNPVVIYLDPGIYAPFSATSLRYISLIGAGKEVTIVRSTTGTYATPAANFRTNGLIFGIAFEMRPSVATVDPDNPYAYGFHSDWGTCKMEFVDCAFYSNAGPAIGIGLHHQERLLFKNCDFISEVDGTYGENISAFYCHTSFTENSKDQYVEIRNCIAINKFRQYGFRMDVLPDVSGCTYEALMIGNGCYDVDGIGGSISQGFLSQKSFGNNNPVFNA